MPETVAVEPLEDHAPGAAQAAPPSRRPLLGWLLRLGLSLALLAWVFGQAETREALGVLDAGTAVWVGVGVAGYALCQMLNAYKWGLILVAQGYRVPVGELIRVYFIGMFSNFFLPTSVGGDVVRVGLMRRHGVPLSSGALSVFMGRYTGLVALLGIGAAGAVAAHVTSAQMPQGFFVGMAALMGGALAAMACGAAIEQRWQLSERLPARLGRAVRQINEGVRRLAGAPAMMVRVLAISLVFQLMIVGLNVVLGLAVGVRPVAVHWFWVVPVTTLGEMLPLGLGGVGTREYVAGQIFAPLGYAERAVVWSLLWQVVKLTTSLPGALLWLRRRKEAADAAVANHRDG